jgi:FAD/FMN-containing dehydrogenase
MGNQATFEELPAKLKSNPLKIGSRPKLNVPVFLPGFVLNTFSVKILNAILYWKQKGGTGFFHYENFFYPLDSIMNWNRGYGRRGFIQYQFVIPFADGHKNIKNILQEIATSGCVPFLNVLKKFGKGQNLLSFPKEGYTFAIDFPITRNLKAFTRKLDQMVLEAGGRIYLGKDAFLDEKSFKVMYPEYKEWLAIKTKYDPSNKYVSDLSRRIGLTQ